MLNSKTSKKHEFEKKDYIKLISLGKDKWDSLHLASDVYNMGIYIQTSHVDFLYI